MRRKTACSAASAPEPLDRPWPAPQTPSARAMPRAWSRCPPSAGHGPWHRNKLLLPSRKCASVLLSAPGHSPDRRRACACWIAQYRRHARSAARPHPESCAAVRHTPAVHIARRVPDHADDAQSATSRQDAPCPGHQTGPAHHGTGGTGPPPQSVCQPARSPETPARQSWLFPVSGPRLPCNPLVFAHNAARLLPWNAAAMQPAACPPFPAPRRTGADAAWPCAKGCCPALPGPSRALPRLLGQKVVWP